MDDKKFWNTFYCYFLHIPKLRNKGREKETFSCKGLRYTILYFIPHGFAALRDRKALLHAKK
jgi:hypothetical protein